MPGGVYVNGDSIIDSYQIVAKLKSYLEEQITTGTQVIITGTLPPGVDESVYQDVLNEYQQTLKEIRILEKSSQIYVVLPAGEGEGGGVSYDTKTGQIIITVEEGTDEQKVGLTAHELKHAYQFEKGKISFNAKTGGVGVLSDITDEIEAYNRQSVIEKGYDFHSYSAQEVIIEGKRHRIDYSILPKNNRTLRTRIGRELRKKTKKARSLGLPPSDIYKNWEKDYYR